MEARKGGGQAEAMAKAQGLFWYDFVNTVSILFLIISFLPFSGNLAERAEVKRLRDEGKKPIGLPQKRGSS